MRNKENERCLRLVVFNHAINDIWVVSKWWVIWFEDKLEGTDEVFKLKLCLFSASLFIPLSSFIFHTPIYYAVTKMQWGCLLCPRCAEAVRREDIISSHCRLRVLSPGPPGLLAASEKSILHDAGACLVHTELCCTLHVLDSAHDSICPINID